MITGQDKFYQSFELDGLSSQRLKTRAFFSEFAAPFNARWITLSTTSTTEVYSFYTDNTEAQLLKVVTITYTDTTKSILQSVGVA